MGISVPFKLWLSLHPSKLVHTYNSSTLNTLKRRTIVLKWNKKTVRWFLSSFDINKISHQLGFNDSYFIIFTSIMARTSLQIDYDIKYVKVVFPFFSLIFLCHFLLSNAIWIYYHFVKNTSTCVYEKCIHNNIITPFKHYFSKLNPLKRQRKHTVRCGLVCRTVEQL